MKIITALLFTTFTTFCFAQIVNIPDVNFKNALITSHCVDADMNGSFESDADLDNDGVIQVYEAEAVQSLNVAYKNISDMTGIESFANLKKLNCFLNAITTANFNTNLLLKEINCSSNNFISLNISGLPLLDTLTVFPNDLLQNLTISNNPILTTLTLSGSFGSLSNLVTLDCSNNALTSLNLYNNNYPFIHLINVDCSNNQLTSLPINSTITTLNAADNLIVNCSLQNSGYAINNLDISNNSLTYLSVFNCLNLSNINYSGNLNLNTLGINNNNFTTLSVHDLPNLQYLGLSFNPNYGGTKYTSLDVYNLPSLISFSFSNNNISNITVADFPNLTTVEYSGNPSLSIMLSNLPAILNFSAGSGNSITIKDMPNLVGLTFDNAFNTIHVLNNPLLNTLTYNQDFINQFELSNAPSLASISFQSIQVIPYNINFNSLPVLNNLYFNIGDACNLNLTNLPLLHQIEINGVTSFNFHNLPQLYSIKSEWGSLTGITVTNLPNLYELKLTHNHLTALNLQNLPNLYTVDVSNNSIGTLTLFNLPLLHDISLYYNITAVASNSYNFLNLPNLYDVNLSHADIGIITLNNLPSLHKFLLETDPNISTITVANMPNLYDLSLAFCSNLTTIIINNLPSLHDLKISNTHIPGITLANLPNLTNLIISNHNSSSPNLNVQLSNLPNLVSLNLSSNSINSLNFNPLPNVTNLNVSLNSTLANLNVSNLHALSTLDISNDTDSLVNLDLSSNPNISSINYSSGSGWVYDHLKYINLRNGANNLTNINVGLSVKNICVDNQAEKTLLQSLDSSLANTIFTSYCSFNPAGTFYNLQGNSLLDTNNNGCDASDMPYPMINLDIISNNGGITSSFFANNTGNYTVPFTSGQYTITPHFENPSYFTFSPSSINVDFPIQNSPLTQNFCIAPNGNHNDLEITFLPFLPARPGFDAIYKLVYKNKGNQVQSGSIYLNFNDNVLDFVSANPINSGQTINLLDWNYTNLQPFETRTINVTFNVNSATEAPPVISGSVLTYNTEITGLTDENPSDNISTLNQTVVNAYDPNDKVCIEGKLVTANVIGEYVHYVVRFQNTGTANAHNVVVKDLIDLSKFDLLTLKPISGSQNFFTRITNTNQVEFIFENINLPFTSGNNNGFVAFKIKTKSNLVVGNSFSNQVNIYFDYNNPILTNNYMSTIQELGVSNYWLKENILVYPNPVTDNLQFLTNENILKVEVYDIEGRILMGSHKFSGD